MQSPLQISWMWADAGIVPGEVAHMLASSNPMRWSSWKGVAETIADLQKLAGDASPRPIKLQVKRDAPEQKELPSIHAAIAHLQAQVATKAKVAKIEALACYRLPFLCDAGESAPGAIVCFGSRPEVGSRLRDILDEEPQLMGIPILVTGKDEEVSEILATVEAMQHGEVHEDRTATSTESNAGWVKQKLVELGLMGKPVVLIAFPVLARSAVDALVVGQGFAEESVFPAFPASSLDQELLALPHDDARALRDGWIDAKLKQARDKAWAGKP